MAKQKINIDQIGNTGSPFTVSTCALTVTGGTAPTYATNSWRTLNIGKLVIAHLNLANASGGTAGTSGNPLFITLPYPAKVGTRIGSGSVYNGGTVILSPRVICNFVVVSQAGSTQAYLAMDDSNITGAMQSNPNRYIYATVVYEKE